MLLSECSTYSKQGNIGLAYAIAYYGKLGYTISIPLTDTQDYDLLVDNNSQILKVQVKTTTVKTKAGNFEVNLRVTGGNRSGTGKSKSFEENDCDLLFVMTEDFSFYSIPREKITTGRSITLGDKYECFRVTLS